MDNTNSSLLLLIILSPYNPTPKLTLMIKYLLLVLIRKGNKPFNLLYHSTLNQIPINANPEEQKVLPHTSNITNKTTAIGKLIQIGKTDFFCCKS